jgi:hypothetical protein
VFIDLLRAALLVITHPFETIDRIRGRRELARRGNRTHAYDVNDDWEARLHTALDRPWPCPELEELGPVWSEIAASLEDVCGGHDADPALARAAWCLVRHLRPDRVVETGVARGVLSRVIMAAMDRNGRGHLWSIDLPPVIGEWRAHVEAAHPNRQRARWTFIRGASSRRLPKLLASLGGIQLFIHDSLHTEQNMLFEFEAAWSKLEPGCALLADDIQESAAFASFLTVRALGTALVGIAETKTSLFGLALKPAET